MKNIKGLLFIISGIIIILFAFANFIFDIPDLISSSQQAKALSSGSTGANPSEPNLKETPTNGEETEENADGQSVPQLKPRIVVVTPQATPAPSTPVEIITGYVPDRIIIPAIRLDAPVIQSTYATVELRDQWFEQWIVPNEYAAGWQGNSALLGMAGNTVIGGHHNEYGKVFGHLVELELGDTIYVYSGNVTFVYKVVEKQLLPEKDVSLDIRKSNAEWIETTEDERLTLVTCWPKRSNTHRLIIVAEPVAESESG